MIETDTVIQEETINKKGNKSQKHMQPHTNTFETDIQKSQSTSQKINISFKKIKENK